MKDLIQRLKNPGVVMALGCLIASLCIQFGVEVDLEWVKNTITIICGIGVTIGIMNNPTTKGIDGISNKE